eukprot:148272-Hanusia_phi.AAC.4
MPSAGSYTAATVMSWCLGSSPIVSMSKASMRASPASAIVSRGRSCAPRAGVGTRACGTRPAWIGGAGRRPRCSRAAPGASSPG